MKHLTTLAIIVALIVSGCSPDRPRVTTDVLKSLKDFKHKSTNKEMTEEVISSLKDSELEQAIVDNISYNLDLDSGDAISKTKQLTAGQRAIYITWILEAEFSNGGLRQFYTNSSKQLAGMEEEAFQTLGEQDFADLMKQANSVYNENRENLQKADAVNPFEKLDETFYRMYEAGTMDQVKVNYIRSHTAEFVSK